MNKKVIIYILLFCFYSQFLSLKANDETYINSSNIIYDEKKNIIELAENSKINIDKINILIDKGIIDYTNDEIEVFGDFYLYEELNILSGKNLKGNTKLDIFSAVDVSYIYNNDLKIDSKKLNRNGNLIYFHDNFITPCELEGYFNCPTWSLRIDKTQYNIEKDKFTHFDSFLQIADYKLFYLPYLSHYGYKAPRQKGFLTPSLQFTIGGEQGIILPYYLPINESSDILFKPKIYFDTNFEILENYDLKTIINKRNAGGVASIEIDNIKRAKDPNVNNTIRLETKNIISKNQVFSASGMFTNSISTTRSINEDPITFEDIYLRLENYNFIKKDDYLKTELSSVESFDTSTKKSIPVSPSINYFNNISFDNFNTINELDFTILKRGNSNENNPSESLKLNINNEFISNYFLNNFNNYNKINFSNSINEYIYNNNTNLNNNSLKSSLILSSDFYFNKLNIINPRIKLILPLQIANTEKLVNEDSNSITFNYQNQYTENRFFGNDLMDTSPRIIYGIENNFKFLNQEIEFNLNQSYDFNKNNSYANKLNQNSELSDYALEATTNYKDLIFKIDTRLDQKNLSKKEMNYSLMLNNSFDLTLNYHETQSKAFNDLSNDTQALEFLVSKKLNENFSASYSTNLDVKNNYNPYKSYLNFSIFDECSQLDLTYTNTRFSDNFNTQPTETINVSFRMDYLGFLGYEQSTDLFFSEPGNINYGL